MRAREDMYLHVHEASDSRVGVEGVEEVSGLEVVSDLGEHERNRVGPVSAVSELVAGASDHLEAEGEASSNASVSGRRSTRVRDRQSTNMWSKASPAGVPSVIETMRTGFRSVPERAGPRTNGWRIFWSWRAACRYKITSALLSNDTRK